MIEYKKVLKMYIFSSTNYTTQIGKIAVSDFLKTPANTQSLNSYY